MRLSDPHGLPLPAPTLLDRARTDWFPEFLSHGRMRPHFQPIVDLASGRVVGREALMRGKLGAVEVRGGELLAAAEAHDALYSFDTRARAAAIETGVPLLPEAARSSSSTSTRAPCTTSSPPCAPPGASSSGVTGGRPGAPLPELVRPERCPDRDLLEALVSAHRRRGALIALDDLAGGGTSLSLPRGAQARLRQARRQGHLRASRPRPGRRRLVAALVECAHEGNALVVAEGVERVMEFEAMKTLGVDLGQGFYFGQPTERPMAVDPRLVRARPELAAPRLTCSARAGG